MGMTPQEAIARAADLDKILKKLFSDARLVGGKAIVGVAALEITEVQPDGSDLVTGEWAVHAHIGWKTTWRGRKFGDFIFIDPETVPTNNVQRDKLLEVLQVQMDRSIAELNESNGER